VLKHPLLGRLNALVAFAAWVCLALLVLGLAYLKLLAAPDTSVLPLMLVFAVFVVLVLAHVAISLFVRCPYCNKQLTAQGFTKPKYGDWSGAITKWFSGSVVCIHCGRNVRTGGSRDHDL
jgi:hypothetical protein